MKKVLSMVLVVTMLFSGCGGAEQTAEVPEKGAVTEPAEQKQEEIDPTKYAIPLELFWKKTSAAEEDVFTGSYDSLRLSAESAAQYPALAEVIDTMREEDRELFTETKAEMIEWAAEDEMDFEYYDENDISVQRADNNIVSIRKDNSCFTGGAHGMYGSWGVNLDPNSGKVLLLSDVVTDMNRIPQLTAESITERYTEELDYEDFSWLEESLEGYLVEEYNWTMDYEGITIYFNPYEIASYAAGLLTAKISFAEHPELFHEAYMLSPKNGYAVRLDFSEHEFDFEPKDGKADSVSVFGYFDDEKKQEKMNCWLNDEMILENLYADAFVPYFVCTKEGGKENYFLYIESANDNEYTMNIYELSKEGASLLKEMAGCGFHRESYAEDGVYESILQDPADIMQKQ